MFGLDLPFPLLRACELSATKRRATDTLCKKPRGNLPLYWAPAEKDLPLVHALLAVEGVEVAFVMEVKKIDDVAMIAPKGVAFTIKARTLPGDSGMVVTLGGVA